jgi:hypothetical protein
MFINLLSCLIEFIILLMQKLQLDRNAASRACQKDRQYIEKLEMELMNCYQEIGKQCKFFTNLIDLLLCVELLPAVFADCKCRLFAGSVKYKEC